MLFLGKLVKRGLDLMRPVRLSDWLYQCDNIQDESRERHADA